MKKKLLLIIGLVISIHVMTSFDTVISDEFVTSEESIETDSRVGKCGRCGGDLEICFTAYKRYFTCRKCKGTGRTPNGQYECSICQGTGQEWEWVTANKCKSCGAIYDID